MSLIVLLAALALTLLWREGEKLHHFQWLRAYFAKFQPFLNETKGLQFYAGYTILLLAPAILLWSFLAILHFYSLVVIVTLTGIIAVWLSLKRPPLEKDYEAYLLALKHQDLDALSRSAEKYLGTDKPNDIAHLSHRVTARMFIQANEGLFAVIFWFLILGPAGALAYRIIVESKQIASPEIAGLATKWQTWLDYIPARFVSLSFSLMGNFIAVMNCLGKYLTAAANQNNILLSQSGVSALNAPLDEAQMISAEEHEEGIYLIHRALIAWLVIVALMVVVNWLS